MSRHEHGSGLLLRSGPPEGLGYFFFPSAEGASNTSLWQRHRNVQRNVPGLGEVVEPNIRWHVSFGSPPLLIGFSSPFCSGLVRSFGASSIGVMPLSAGARPPCGLDLRLRSRPTLTLATRAARQNSLVRTTELKQCRAISTGQARYFGQVRKRDWEVSSFRTGPLRAPKVRSHSSLGQRPRNLQHHVPRPRRGRITQLSLACFVWFASFVDWVFVSVLLWPGPGVWWP